MASQLCVLLAAQVLASAAQDPTQLRGRANATRLYSMELSPQAEDVSSSTTHLTWLPDSRYCLSSDANRIEDGVDIQLWLCDQTWSSAGQNFFLSQSSGRIRMDQNPDYCLEVAGDGYQNGARVQLGRCDEDKKTQVWSFDETLMTVHAPTQKCVVINYNKAFNGAKIQLWSCDGIQAQSWRQVSLGASRRTAFFQPAAGRPCESPWQPVATSAQCLEGTEALYPGGAPCFGESLSWASSLAAGAGRAPTCHGGCFTYSACLGCGANLGFNPVARAGCPMSGNCWTMGLICQIKVP